MTNQRPKWFSRKRSELHSIYIGNQKWFSCIFTLFISLRRRESYKSTFCPILLTRDANLATSRNREARSGNSDCAAIAACVMTVSTRWLNVLKLFARDWKFWRSWRFNVSGNDPTGHTHEYDSQQDEWSQFFEKLRRIHTQTWKRHLEKFHWGNWRFRLPQKGHAFSFRKYSKLSEPFLQYCTPNTQKKIRKKGAQLLDRISYPHLFPSPSWDSISDGKFNLLIEQENSTFQTKNVRENAPSVEYNNRHKNRKNKTKTLLSLKCIQEQLMSLRCSLWQKQRLPKQAMENPNMLQIDILSTVDCPCKRMKSPHRPPWVRIGRWHWTFQRPDENKLAHTPTH